MGHAYPMSNTRSFALLKRMSLACLGRRRDRGFHRTWQWDVHTCTRRISSARSTVMAVCFPAHACCLSDSPAPNTSCRRHHHLSALQAGASMQQTLVFQVRLSAGQSAPRSRSRRSPSQTRPCPRCAAPGSAPAQTCAHAPQAQPDAVFSSICAKGSILCCARMSGHGRQCTVH